MIVVVLMTTYYASTDEWRAKLAVETIRSARRYQLVPVAVDASQSAAVTASLRDAGAIVIHEPETLANQGKGFAYRHGMMRIQTDYRDVVLADSVNVEFVVVMCEPEKVDFMRVIPSIVTDIASSAVDIVVPHRDDGGFASLPIEQMYNERFANAHINNVAAALADSLHLSPPNRLPTLDWMFGPVVFRSSLLRYWTQCELRDWNAQIVPFIRAFADGHNVDSRFVDYKHPAVQKQEEQGRVEWSRKRLMQTQVIVPVVEKELTSAMHKRAHANDKNGELIS